MIPLTIPFSSVFDWSPRHDQFLINFQPKLTTFTVSGPKFCLARSKLVDHAKSVSRTSSGWSQNWLPGSVRFNIG